MAARKKPKKSDAIFEQGNLDPRAPLDGAALLGAAAPLMRMLADDLLARARSSPSVLRGLDERWRGERDARRTADPFEVWQRAFVEQVAAAWLLSCVFVRTLEDRGLIAQNRIAGPGAADSQKAFFELAPSLSERDYLLTTFRELSHLPAARDLFDRRHNPVWMLGPSVGATRTLLAFFRAPSADAPTFRFGGRDTRFLGDLYQDLSEDVRNHFALLQTPLFVEEYILDRTLTRAVARFGLEQTSLIDPTCGSGHFLLGAFARLCDAFLRAEPGLDPRQAAQKALDRVAGSDINPYAVAIARFRLVLAFVEAGKYARLADAPEPKIHLAVADSLLHGKDGGAQKTLADIGGVTAEEIWGHVYALEDAVAARDVLDKRYAAVVGNPPYIMVQDAALRDEIRKSYPKSAIRKYSLAAPFAERFFQLARSGGAVGMITANSFMKREFGKKLIEEVLPHLNLDGIVNTSGAYIPGHGTPTVLLFGTNEAPIGKDVLSVLAKRGEPSTPDDPEQGLVWRSIVDHGSEVGFENDYLSVARVERVTLGKHPWSLGGGGAAELKELLEERAAKRLGDVSDSIGFMAITGEDEAFVAGGDVFSRQRLPSRVFGYGEVVRDWIILDELRILFPYDESWRASDSTSTLRWLWPLRTTLRTRLMFGKTQEEAGLDWFVYRHVGREKLSTPLSITFAFVATHNHFVLDRGGKVFNRSAPIIKLPPDATEDDHLALLAYLNSSTACFWMKQVFFQKSSQNYVGDVRDKPERIHYEFAGTGLAKLPVPKLDARLREFGSELDRLAQQRAEDAPASVLGRNPVDHRAELDSARQRELAAKRRMVALQEELDWHVYELFGLLADYTSTVPSIPHEMDPDERAFLRQPSQVPIEVPLFKRPWFGVQGVFQRDEVPWIERVRVALDAAELERIEVAVSASARPMPTSRDEDDERDGHRVAPIDEAMPFLAAYRYTDAGMEKRAAWEHTWELQRREDAGEKIADIPIPPKYGQGDYREASYWRLRGKLDVPKERFISYPGCESDDDKQPLYGWAGWDHKHRALALMTLYQERKTKDGWPRERLIPILAGLRELLPWLRQWHTDVDADLGISMADYFAGLYETERAYLAVTDQDLADWRPAPKVRGRKKA